VRQTLQIADDSAPNVFALGDVADTGANKAARPGTAQAKVVARNIVRLIEGKTEELETYTFDSPAIHLTLGIVSGCDDAWCGVSNLDHPLDEECAVFES
jgi:apoptosis-inducing factor 2